MKVYVGIDIGKSGGIAVINEIGDILTIRATPTVGGEISVAEIADLIRNLTVKDPMVVLEDVHSIYGSSAKSNFQFGRSLGIMEGVVAAMGCSWAKVAPKTWQKEMWLGVERIAKKGKSSTDTKAMSLIAVNRIFPEANLLPTPRSTKPHDGMVDALLLAEYGRRKF